METTMDHERSATRETAGDSRFLLARPAAILRIEGATLLAASAMLCWANGGSWWLFALLLLAPDVSMLGYLAGPRIGAAAYNAFHSYPLPATLGLLGMLWGTPLVAAVALVWLAHIGMDRLVGYGLKYPSGFKDTHLRRV